MPSTSGVRQMSMTRAAAMSAADTIARPSCVAEPACIHSGFTDFSACSALWPAAEATHVPTGISPRAMLLTTAETRPRISSETRCWMATLQALNPHIQKIPMMNMTG